MNGPFFRPYPGLTFAAILLAGMLCGLGFWQLERLQWKQALIATVNSHIVAPPVSLDDALSMDAELMRYRRVTLKGRFDNTKESYVFTTGEGGAAVYHVLTPFLAEHGRVLMVDRGAVPKEKLAPASHSTVTGATQITGVWRTPEPPGLFTPPPDPAHRLWYARDLRSMSAIQGLHLAAQVVVEAGPTPNPGGWPRGGQTVVSFSNNHLSYAITWFGLAAGLLGVYLAYHVSKGRLGWLRKKA